MPKIFSKFVHLAILAIFCLCLSTPLVAQEVDKGKIPADQLANAYKNCPGE